MKKEYGVSKFDFKIKMHFSVRENQSEEGKSHRGGKGGRKKKRKKSKIKQITF